MNCRQQHEEPRFTLKSGAVRLRVGIFFRFSTIRNLASIFPDHHSVTVLEGRFRNPHPSAPILPPPPKLFRLIFRHFMVAIR